MTYQYKETTSQNALALVSVLLDIFFLPWLLMKVWNEGIVDVLKIDEISYINALLLKIAYSALTSCWFSAAYSISSNENRFNDFANMVSVRFKLLTDTVKLTQPPMIQPYLEV